METAIFSLSRRAEQTFTRIRLLDQLPGVDLLPRSSLQCKTSDLHGPNLRGPFFYTPLLLWQDTDVCDITAFCETWIILSIQSPQVLTSGEGKAGDMLLIVFP